jgi:uracil-DNA glycosylase family 4
MADRRTVLASLRDYVEQLGEEGLAGAPLPVGRPTDEPSGAIQAAPTSRNSQAASAGPPKRLFSPYTGLEQTMSLGGLQEFIGDCRRCKLAPGRKNLVFGVGDPQSDLMFVGEAPGADEDEKGEPFVGRAGQLLTDIIERGMQMKRSDVYICNVIKCRPPGNRNPEPDEVEKCEPFLLRQIELVKPKVIVGLGTFAVQALLKVKTPISRLRGVWHDFQGIMTMPTFHPAYLLRNPGDKRLVWSDIQQVMRMLGKATPSKTLPA